MARVLQLTTQMLAASKSHEWDVLATLQQQREQLLRIVSPFTQSAMEPDRMLATLRQILLMNEELTSIARDECRRRQVKLEGLHRGRRAARSYRREAQTAFEFRPAPKK